MGNCQPVTRAVIIVVEIAGNVTLPTFHYGESTLFSKVIPIIDCSQNKVVTLAHLSYRGGRTNCNAIFVVVEYI